MYKQIGVGSVINLFKLTRYIYRVANSPWFCRKFPWKDQLISCFSFPKQCNWKLKKHCSKVKCDRPFPLCFAIRKLYVWYKEKRETKVMVTTSYRLENRWVLRPFFEEQKSLGVFKGTGQKHFKTYLVMSNGELLIV